MRKIPENSSSSIDELLLSIKQAIEENERWSGTEEGANEFTFERLQSSTVDPEDLYEEELIGGSDEVFSGLQERYDGRNLTEVAGETLPADTNSVTSSYYDELETETGYDAFDRQYAAQIGTGRTDKQLGVRQDDFLSDSVLKFTSSKQAARSIADEPSSDVVFDDKAWEQYRRDKMQHIQEETSLSSGRGRMICTEEEEDSLLCETAIPAFAYSQTVHREQADRLANYPGADSDYATNLGLAVTNDPIGMRRTISTNDVAVATNIGTVAEDQVNLCNNEVGSDGAVEGRGRFLEQRRSQLTSDLAAGGNIARAVSAGVMSRQRQDDNSATDSIATLKAPQGGSQAAPNQIAGSHVDGFKVVEEGVGSAVGSVTPVSDIDTWVPEQRADVSGMISENVASSVQNSVQALLNLRKIDNLLTESILVEQLQPLLKDWLSGNLADLVEKIVREEIAKLFANK